jgi:hypothetical protein
VTNPLFFAGGVDLQAPPGPVIGQPVPVVVQADLSRFAASRWICGQDDNGVALEFTTLEIISRGKPLVVEHFSISSNAISVRIDRQSLPTPGLNGITVHTQVSFGQVEPTAIVRSGSTLTPIAGTFLVTDRVFRDSNSALGELVGWYDYDLNWFVPAGSRVVVQSAFVNRSMFWNIQCREGQSSSVATAF